MMKILLLSPYNRSIFRCQEANLLKELKFPADKLSCLILTLQEYYTKWFLLSNCTK